MHAKSSKPSMSFFSGMPLMPVPIKGVEMAIRHKSRTTDGIRESFLSLDSFPLRFKNINIFLTLLGGQSPPSSPMDPSPVHVKLVRLCA